MKFVLFISALLSSQALLAANAPTKMNLLALESQFITIENKEQAIVQKNVVDGIKALSGGILDLPANVGFIIPKTYESPFFDPMAVTLVAPYQMVIGGRSKNPVFTRGVELHEFGHAIFNENMELILKKQPEFLKRWAVVKKLINKTSKTKAKLLRRDIVLELLQKKIETEKASASSPMAVELGTIYMSYEDEQLELERTYAENEHVLQDLSAIIQSLTPYNEFFADVVAVVVTDDAQSISNALHFAHDHSLDASERIPYEDRSFNRRASRRPQDGTPHNFYSLSRNYIYKYYLSNPIYKAKGKPWLVRKTMDAVSCGINNQNALADKLEAEAKALLAKNPKMDVNAFFIEKLNDGLNRCMDSVFQ